MNPEILKERTKQFGIRIINLYDALSKTRKGEILGNQLLRSGISVGANYRAACRAKSNADFIIRFRLLKKNLTSQHIGLN